MGVLKSFLTLSSHWRTLLPVFGYILEVGMETLNYFKTTNLFLGFLYTYFFLIKGSL